MSPITADKLAQQSVTFSCRANGSPQPTITWFHNGAKVPASTTGRVQISSNNELKFTSLQLGDKGTVQCVATNAGGEEIATAVLRVRCKYMQVDRVLQRDTLGCLTFARTGRPDLQFVNETRLL